MRSLHFNWLKTASVFYIMLFICQLNCPNMKLGNGKFVKNELKSHTLNTYTFNNNL